MSLTSFDRNAKTGFVWKIPTVRINGRPLPVNRTLTEFASRVAADLPRYVPN